MKNPFKAGPPVSQEQFYGRQSELNTIIRRLEEVKENALSDRYIILNGHRGLGKSSVIKHIRSLPEVSKDVLYVDVKASTQRSYSNLLESVVNKIFRGLKNEVKKQQGVWDSFVSGVRDLTSFVEGISIAGVKVEWSAKSNEANQTEEAFIEAVPEIWEKVKENSSYKALVIVIDELDILEQNDKEEMLVDMAYGLKTIADEWLNEQQDIFILISSLTSVYDELLKKQPSLDRMFEEVHIGPFSDADITDMFSKIFAYGEPRKSASEEYIQRIKHISGGIPYYIQQISKIAFEHDLDDVLDEDDFITALPLTAKALDGKFMSIIRDRVMARKHAMRVLRIVSAFDITNIKLTDIRDNFVQSFSQDGGYIRNLLFELGEDELNSPTQADAALYFLRSIGLIERVAQGYYKMADPLTDFWVNLRINEYGLEEALRKSQ